MRELDLDAQRSPLCGKNNKLNLSSKPLAWIIHFDWLIVIFKIQKGVSKAWDQPSMAMLRNTVIKMLGSLCTCYRFAIKKRLCFLFIYWCLFIQQTPVRRYNSVCPVHILILEKRYISQTLQLSMPRPYSYLRETLYQSDVTTQYAPSIFLS